VLPCQMGKYIPPVFLLNALTTPHIYIYCGVPAKIPSCHKTKVITHAPSILANCASTIASCARIRSRSACSRDFFSSAFAADSLKCGSTACTELRGGSGASRMAGNRGRWCDKPPLPVLSVGLADALASSYERFRVLSTLSGSGKLMMGGSFESDGVGGLYDVKSTGGGAWPFAVGDGGWSRIGGRCCMAGE
jgi:hypothetical protein